MKTSNLVLCDMIHININWLSKQDDDNAVQITNLQPPITPYFLILLFLLLLLHTMDASETSIHNSNPEWLFI